MRRLDLLVEKVRRYTSTQSYTDAAALGSQIGLQTQTIVDLFNEAQYALHGLIYSNAPEVFVTTNTQNVTADTEAYAIPSDSFLNVNIISVEYKLGSGTNDFYKLRRRNLHERDTTTTGTPAFYIQHENEILLNPIPSQAVTNGLRITYEYQLPELDVRRGKVSSTTSTTIVMTSADNADIAFGASAMPEYVSVVDKDGNIQQKNISVTSYDSSTDTITVSTNPTSVSANDYVVIGDNATTHSFLPDFCENFLVYYVTTAVMQQMGHPSTAAFEARLREFGAQVADVYSDYHTDIVNIPLNYDNIIIEEDLS